jgi:hypothetical protein
MRSRERPSDPREWMSEVKDMLEIGQKTGRHRGQIASVKDKSTLR